MPCSRLTPWAFWHHAPVAIWRDLEAAAPAIARLGSERFDLARVALIGTLRKDGSPTEAACVFSVDIERATFVSWQIERGGMTVRSWSPHAGYRETTRDYA